MIYSMSSKPQKNGVHIQTQRMDGSGEQTMLACLTFAEDLVLVMDGAAHLLSF